MPKTQLYDVNPGKPFGPGGSSLLTLNSDIAARARVVSGVATDDELQVDNVLGTFNDGDYILIHRTRYSADAGKWEPNQIISGAGTSTWTLAKPLDRDYASTTGQSNSNQAQVCQFISARNMILNSFAVEPWRAAENYASLCRGGFLAIAVSELCLINGIPNVNGVNGSAANGDHNGVSQATFCLNFVGGGFRGGWNTTDGNHSGCGEGEVGGFVIESGSRQSAYSGAGVNGNSSGNTQKGFNGSSADLLTALFAGGAGGGHGNNGNDRSSSGPTGAGGIFIWARRFKFGTSGGLQLKGAQSATDVWASQGYAGATSGGFCLINSELPEIGTDKLDLSGGAGGPGRDAGDKGVVRVNYGKKVVGSTSLANITSARDPKLIAPAGFMAFFGR